MDHSCDAEFGIDWYRRSGIRFRQSESFDVLGGQECPTHTRTAETPFLLSLMRQ